MKIFPLWSRSSSNLLVPPVHNSQREWITICWTTEATTRKLFHVSLVSFLTIIKCLNDTILWKNLSLSLSLSFSLSWLLFEKKKEKKKLNKNSSRFIFEKQTTLDISFFLSFFFFSLARRIMQFGPLCRFFARIVARSFARVSANLTSKVNKAPWLPLLIKLCSLNTSSSTVFAILL